MTDADKNRPNPSGGLEQKQGGLLSRAMTDAGITTGELWLRYFSIGGHVGEYEVEAYIQSLLTLPPAERDLLAHAANEIIDELPPRPRAPYVEDLQPPVPTSEQQETTRVGDNGRHDPHDVRPRPPRPD
jgi:hypothetical protein